ncbi:hypothetical protein QE152_g26302 [Popillia japonica]|uniref:Uncharacterized protein n=1 Tax=Popillia japonica TaxID=7064 RepID=A0AAW1JZ13_POPJA
MHHHRDRQSPGRTIPSERSHGRDHRSTSQTISGSTGYHQVSQSRRSPEALDPTCRATPVPGEPAQPTGRAIPGQESPAKQNPARFVTPSTGEPTSHRYHQHPIQGRPTNLHHRAHARPSWAQD